MRFYSAEALAYLQGRDGIEVHDLIWIVARDRESGDPAPLGLWTGGRELALEIAGDPRVYVGAGTFLSRDPIRAGLGVRVRYLSVELSSITPEAAEAIRLYDSRRARVEMHRALFDPLSRLLVEEPHRIWSGEVDGLGVSTGAQAVARVDLASSARRLTGRLPLFRSDAAMRLRSGGGDGFRKYADISGATPVWWGERRHQVAPPVAPSANESAPDVPQSDGGSGFSY